LRENAAVHGGADRRAPVAPISEGPLPVIDLLDGAFAALRHRPRALLSIVAVIVLPFALLEGYLSRGLLGGSGLNDLLADPTLLESTSQSATGGFVVYVLDWAQLALAGVPVSLVIGGWLHGRDVGVREALWFTVRRSWVIVAAFVLIHLAEMIGFVLLFFPGLFLVMIFALTSPVIALEETLGPIKAMQRSSALVRRRLGSVVGVVGLTGVVSYGVSNAVELLPSVVSLVIGTDRAWPLISVASMLSSMVLVPFTSGAMCLLYLDICFRIEGLDLTVRSRRASEADDG
jgi:hypothetical protein